MRNPLYSALVLAVLALPLPALAQDEGSSGEMASEEAADDGTGFSWELAFTTSYQFRGVSQTDGDPALQAGLSYTWANGAYAGIWASNVDFGFASPSVEYDTYVCWNTDLSDTVNFDIMLTRYNYAGEPSGLDGAYDYNELIGVFTFNEAVSLELGYTNDFYNGGDDSLFIGVAGSWEIPGDVTLDANIGRTTFPDGFGPSGYTNWGLSFSRAMGDATVSLGFEGTDGNGRDFYGDFADNRAILTVSLGN
jgi:uncharacterized protein (TIGR02001 family)